MTSSAVNSSRPLHACHSGNVVWLTCCRPTVGASQFYDRYDTDAVDFQNLMPSFWVQSFTPTTHSNVDTALFRLHCYRIYRTLPTAWESEAVLLTLGNYYQHRLLLQAFIGLHCWLDYCNVHSWWTPKWPRGLASWNYRHRSIVGLCQTRYSDLIRLWLTVWNTRLIEVSDRSRWRWRQSRYYSGRSYEQLLQLNTKSLLIIKLLCVFVSLWLLSLSSI